MESGESASANILSKIPHRYNTTDLYNNNLLPV